jgi:hypothetical protein
MVQYVSQEISRQDKDVEEWELMTIPEEWLPPPIVRVRDSM